MLAIITKINKSGNTYGESIVTKNYKTEQTLFQHGIKNVQSSQIEIYENKEAKTPYKVLVV